MASFPGRVAPVLAVVVVLGGVPALATAWPAVDVDAGPTGTGQGDAAGNVTVEHLTFERVVFENVTIGELSVDTLVTGEDTLPGLTLPNVTASNLVFENVTWARVTASNESAFGAFAGSEGRVADGSERGTNASEGTDDGQVVIVEDVRIERLTVDTLVVQAVRRGAGTADPTTGNGSRFIPVVMPDTRVVEQLTVDRFRVDDMRVACFCQDGSAATAGLGPRELADERVGGEQVVRDLHVGTFNATNASSGNSSGVGLTG